ncbi:type VI secretion system Vgr family protein [Proteus mirabilis]|uniref:type VI secretion system Vgr family protein n=1 Tax=Proteus mirabilis TaxID=584 RepID=UPI0029EE476C|nr:type VI secretion system tip protein VgrG [Proteus mirabilis]
MSANNLNAKNTRLGNIDKNHSIHEEGYAGGLGRTYAQDQALQRAHGELIDRIMNGEHGSGLVFTCSISGLPENTFQITKFNLQEGLSQLFVLNIQAVSSMPTLDFKDILGGASSITVKRDGVKIRIVQGILASAEQVNTDGVKNWYQFIIRPEMWVMTLKQDSRIFQNMSIPQVLKTLLDEAHIKHDMQLYHPDEHPVRPYITQKRESMYDFWCRLAAEEGINFWFEEGPKLFYSDRHLGMTAGIKLTYNPQSNTDVTDSTATTWRYAEQLCSDIRVDKDYNQIRPSYPLSHQVTGEIHQQHEIFESYGRFQEDAQGKVLNQIRYEESQNQRKMGHANTNCFALHPGKVFTLVSHPNTSMNDSWQVISLNHSGVQPLSDNSEGEGTHISNSVSFIPGTKEWRPPFRYKPTADGNELATVVGPPGEEIYTDSQGAVTVYFHWDRRGKPDHTASCWVRVAQGWNGNGFGFMSVPRVGQEVIISYLNNDIDNPIIIGCTYNGRNAPPLTLPAEKTKTTFKTKTHKGEGFNELRFEDKANREEIYLHGQKDFNIDILHNENTIIGHNRLEHIKNDAHLTVDNEYRVLSKQPMSFTSETDLNIKTNNSLYTLSDNEIHLKAGSKVVIDAGVELTLQAAGHFIKIDAGGISSSGMINMGSGSPSTGSGWQGKLPDIVSLTGSSITQNVLPDIPFISEEICISCLMKATMSGQILLIRGEKNNNES